MQRVLLLLILGSVVACSTTEISVHSTPPGADVYARAVGKDEFVHYGKTPINLANTQFGKDFNGSGAIQVELRMEGFKPDTFFVTEVSRVNLDINRDLEPKRDFEMQAWLDKHVSRMFEVRQLVQMNRYKDALKIIQSLKEQTPMVATLHNMEGGVQLLLRDYAAALQAYRTAARLNPEDAEAVKMVRHLESTYGYRREVNIFESPLLKEREPSSSDPTKPEVSK